ncbi:MAG: YraN family protein [Eggerthellaceae bacterium]|nr:YraN family protein [Eggerthellaceae bacterium]
MKYLVTGTKSGKEKLKKFACREDAEAFAESCKWDDAKVERIQDEPEDEDRESSMDVRAKSAAARYLELVGYDIIEREYGTPAGYIDIIAEDEDGCLVFIKVKHSSLFKDGFMPADHLADHERAAREAQAAWFFSDADQFVEMPVRFDEIHLLICGTDRAMIRHYANVMGCK